MIATGGLLRINRRQDSQHSENQAENKRKRKQAKRKKNDVVVVKGKLNLCSPPGLVATVGLVLLMVGIAMAVLGYWPHEGHSQGYASGVSPGEERRDNGRMSYSKSPLVSVTWSNNKDNNTAKQTVEELTNQTVEELTNQTVVELTNQTVGELTNQTVGELTNQTVGELTNQTVVELTNQTVGELTNQIVGELINQTVEELTNQTVGELTNQTVGELTNQTVGELTNQTVEELTNQRSVELTSQTSVFVNGSVSVLVSGNGSVLVSVSTPPPPIPSGGLLSEFLDNYLSSDHLKVFGPLVMGIGIFIFLCANAVLHENRDKKTKVINLRDIYSTVIDLHSTRTTVYSPSNGLVNYVHSRGSFNPSGTRELGGSSWLSNTGSGHQGESVSTEQQSRRPSIAGRQRSWSRDDQTFTDTVYSIYRDQKCRCSEQVSYPRQWDSEQASLPSQWDSEQASLPRQRDSEQASVPRQWDSEQASLPRQRDSEQASVPRQWDSEQASYPRQWNSEQASLPRQWNSEQASYFIENGIEEEQVAGYSLGTKEKDASRRGSLKDAFRRSSTSLTPQELTEGLAITLTEHQEGATGTDPRPTGLPTIPFLPLMSPG